MQLAPFPFQTLQWDSIPKEAHPGETGTAWWQVFMMNDIRVRMVEYSPGYKADHWCSKGHIILCLSGQLDTLLADGRTFTLTPGMTYHVGDDCEAHQSTTANGCKLFIVD